MGNSCTRCVTGEHDGADLEDDREMLLSGQFHVPNGPPPPYQEHAPQMHQRLSDRNQVQWLQRIALIHRLPWDKFSLKDEKDDKTGKEDNIKECAICMMDFATGEPIRFLPCMHYYHTECVDDWLMRSPTCPTCMQRVDLALSSYPWSQSNQQLSYPRNSSTSSLSSESSQSSHTGRRGSTSSTGCSGAGSTLRLRPARISRFRPSRQRARSPPSNH